MHKIAPPTLIFLLTGLALAAPAAGPRVKGARASRAAAAPAGDGGVVPANTLLSSGVAQSFSLPAVSSYTVFSGDRGYRIQVPSGATRLEVRLATNTPGVNLDLYVAYGQDISQGCPDADQCAEGPTGNETILTTPCTVPSLTAGTYFIAIGQNTTGVAASGTITATVDFPLTPPSTGALLTSGTPASFSFSAVSGPTLFNGTSSYRIVVPQGATQLRVQLHTNEANTDVDLYARWNADVVESGGNYAADHCSETLTGDETITVQPTSFPPLRAGTYFIALVLFTSGKPATGTVTATVTGGGGGIGPAIEVSQTGTLDFGSVAVGQTKSLTFNVRNTGASALTVSSLSFNPASGPFSVTSPAVPFTLVAGGQQTVTVRFAPTATGAQSATLAIGRIDAARPSVTISVQGAGAAAGSQPAIALSATALNFAAQVGANPSSQTFTVRNSGGGTLNFQVARSQAWLSVSPSQGTSTGADVTITVSVNTAGLAAGTYTDNIQISDQGSPPAAAQTLRVTLTISTGPPQPAIGVSAAALTFNAPSGSNPPPQTVEVRNTGAGTLNFRLTPNRPWITVAPDRGTSTGAAVAITVTVNTAGLGAGEQTGEIQISEAAGGSAATADPAQAAPVTIAVRLIIGGPGAVPVIAPGGIVNAASFVASGLPGGAIARGSIFSLFGSNLGPATLATVSAFPLATTLSGVSLRVSGGGAGVDAIPLAVSAGQINALMPSNAPLGDATITVTYNGTASAAVSVRVSESSFGIFTVLQSGLGPGIIQNYLPQAQPINSTVQTARPRQVVTLWGTGLGAINGADNVAPPVGNLPVETEILVGGKPVSNKLYSGRAPCCAGLDQIVFEIPEEAPLGCYVPVQVRVRNVTSNTVTMAIEGEGKPCTDPANPLTAVAVRGGKQGVVSLVRITARPDAARPSQTLRADLAYGSFRDERGGEFAFHPLGSLPPPGSCTVYTTVDLSALLNARLPAAAASGRALDAGASLQVTGLSASRSVSRPADAGGNYFAVLGSTAAGQPGLFLDDASYIIEGSGGEVGAFRAEVRRPPDVNWTNRDQLLSITRSQGAAFSWTGGDADLQSVLILGGNKDLQTGASGSFLCVAPLAAGAFTIPPAVLASLPPSNLQQPGQSVGYLFLGATPSAGTPRFTAPGLDAGFAYFASVDGGAVTYR